ncbi:site-specific DNA-methyltransferase [bacterium M00.F.Ca.ET.228.01.1.1]|nr:site-specific DNA-methyltransferase [bacterium M00.F.Ca.ET.228.01.1.1]TGS00891.1 site-specific DNA-methyltransferase [bacterium M00.F.Ca.ET.191.01.1.1]TGU05276.1 site-specific DNA-methyltransferase [bacterium M00.F.Ca.ET.155.01.1.1]
MRKETIGGATLYLGDCREILPTLPRVDAVITDPPYSEKTHKMAKTNKGVGHGTKLITFSSFNGKEFDLVVEACVAVSDGWVVATCDYKHAARWYESPNFVRLGAWVKPNPMPQISADRPGQGFEAVLILHSGGRKKAWNRGGGAAVWTFPVHSGSEVPTQKPLALIESFVDDFTNLGETILDPFLGSGTTGVAALRMGRKFIGCEVNERHFEIACRRIEDARRQGSLFDADALRAEQMGFAL